MAQYKIGTATFTNSSAAVTGSGTLWLANISAGDSIVRVGDNVAYEVSGVASDASLTLTAPYGGVTGSGLSYVAHIDFLPNGLPKFANGDVEFAAIQNQYNANLPNLPFGTAASADLTTSATDTTTGRVTKVGDFGWGTTSLNQMESLGATDLDTLTTTTLLKINTAAAPNLPIGVPSGSVLQVMVFDTDDIQQVIYSRRTSSGLWWRTQYAGAFEPWVQLYHTGNLNTLEFGGVSSGTQVATGFARSASTARFTLPISLFSVASSLTIGAGNFSVHGESGASFGVVTSASMTFLSSISSERQVVIDVTGLSGMTAKDAVFLRSVEATATITVNP